MKLGRYLAMYAVLAACGDSDGRPSIDAPVAVDARAPDAPARRRAR